MIINPLKPQDPLSPISIKGEIVKEISLTTKSLALQGGLQTHGYHLLKALWRSIGRRSDE
jgi:hypothetical protein